MLCTLGSSRWWLQQLDPHYPHTPRLRSWVLGLAWWRLGCYRNFGNKKMIKDFCLSKTKLQKTVQSKLVTGNPNAEIQPYKLLLFTPNTTFSWCQVQKSAIYENISHVYQTEIHSRTAWWIIYFNTWIISSVYYYYKHMNSNVLRNVNFL